MDKKELSKLKKALKDITNHCAFRKDGIVMSIPDLDNNPKIISVIISGNKETPGAFELICKNPDYYPIIEKMGILIDSIHLKRTLSGTGVDIVVDEDNELMSISSVNKTKKKVIDDEYYKDRLELERDYERDSIKMIEKTIEEKLHWNSTLQNFNVENELLNKFKLYHEGWYGNISSDDYEAPSKSTIDLDINEFINEKGKLINFVKTIEPDEINVNSFIRFGNKMVPNLTKDTTRLSVSILDDFMYNNVKLICLTTEDKNFITNTFYGIIDSKESVE